MKTESIAAGVGAASSRIRVVRLVLLASIALTYLIIPSATEDPVGTGVRSWLDPVAWIVVWFVTFRLTNGISRAVLLDALSQQWRGTPMPRLFRDLFSACLFAAFLALTARTAFGAALVPLYATSGILTIVLGLALQSIILDFFVGFAIHVDHPFRIGDWIRLDDGTQAEVVALTWRTVQLRTEAGESMYVPNGELGRAQFVNLWQDARPVRFSHNLILEYDVKPERGFRVLRAALRSVEGSDGILDDPSPSVVIRDTDQQGTHYLLHWWMYPYRPVSPNLAKSRVITAAIDHLQSAGLAIALPVTVSPREMAHVPVVQSAQDRSALLRLNRLMAPLGDELVAALDPELRIRLVEAGTVVLERGEQATCVSMLLEGLCTAWLPHPTEPADVQAYSLEPGTYFGEHMLDGGRPSTVRIVAASESVLVEIGLQRVFQLMEATAGMGLEVRELHRHRQRLVYDAARIERLAPTEATDAETALRSVMRNLAGRARSIRPSGPRLLVVDDSRLQRHQIAEIAMRAGWTICGEAADGVEALELYRDLRPDLVTMDLVMPRCDGLQALQNIKDFHPHARVVMVSAVDQTEKLERAMDLGALDFVVKPYDAERFADLLRHLLAERAPKPAPAATVETPSNASSKVQA